MIHLDQQTYMYFNLLPLPRNPHNVKEKWISKKIKKAIIRKKQEVNCYFRKKLPTQIYIRSTRFVIYYLLAAIFPVTTETKFIDCTQVHDHNFLKLNDALLFKKCVIFDSQHMLMYYANTHW